MHLLITNDDGYLAKGIQTLARVAVQAGHSVFICAPSTEQSATSHRLTLSHPLTARSVPCEWGSAYAIDGSPVDCMRIGQYLSDRPFDFCLSGINDGENVGSGLYYSGTAAAAREAVMNYLPSIAVSIETDATEDMREHLAKEALRMMEYLHQNPMPRMTFCNINAPALSPEHIKGIRRASISQAFFTDGYVKCTAPRGTPYFWMDAGSEPEKAEAGSDLYLLKKGYITVTFVGGFIDRNDQYPETPIELNPHCTESR